MTSATPAPGTVTTWNLDPAHSVRRVQGEAHDDFQREGQFTGLSGTLKLDETNYTHSTVEAIDSGGHHQDGRRRSATGI